MTLTAGDLSYLLQYMISFFRISIPFLATLFILVVWAHYRGKRKKTRKTAGAADNTLNGIPEYSLLMPPSSAAERMNAVKKCREQFSGSKAKYTALKYDFINLQEKGKDFYYPLPGKNNKTMENFQEKIAAFEKQVAELQNKIEMLETIPPPQNNEAHYLRELLAEKEREVQELHKSVNDLKQTHTSEPVQITNSFLPEDQQLEVSRLKNLVDEQAHITDLLDEARQQITFLQNQLEQRVKANKTIEQKLAAVSEELSQSQFFFQEAGRKSLETEKLLQAKQKEMEGLQKNMAVRETELLLLQDELHSKNDQLLAVENSFNEIRQQNELLNASVSDNQDVITSLRDKLAGEQQKNENLQERLAKNRQLLHRFYKELESSVEGVSEQEDHLIVA